MILAERERLLADTTLAGRAWCEAWTAAIDGWLTGLYDDVFGDRKDVCLLAVGGTGRREMAPRSDIDVMASRGSAKKIEAGLADLCIRSGTPACTSARRAGQRHRRRSGRISLDTATTLLAGRWIAGDHSLADEVLAGVQRSWRADGGAWLSLLRDRGLARHRNDGDVAFLLEPNIKEGRGGLRDLHELLWIDAAGHGIALESPAVVAAAYDTLIHARVALHRAAPVAGEVLRLEDQDAVAAAGDFGSADDFMAAVASAARTLSWQHDRAWHAVARAAMQPVKPRPLASGVTLRNGEVELGVDVWPEDDPTLMLQVGLGAARTESPIATRALETLSERTPDWPQPWPTGAAEELVALLLEGPRAIPVLESLDRAELIARMLPGSGRPVQPFRNAALSAVHRRSPSVGRPRCRPRFARRSRRPPGPTFVIGALCTDIGKGYPGDHTERGEELVAAIGPRMGFDDRDTDHLVRLVRHHLLLPDIATRRDLDDPATIDAVADAVGSVMFLDLLHTLTEADSLATGSSAWSPWKAELVDELVERVRMRLGAADGVDGGPERRSPFPTRRSLALMGAGETAVRVDGPNRRGQPRPTGDVRPARRRAGAARHRRVGGPRTATSRAWRHRCSVLLVRGSVDWTAVESDIRRALAGRLALSAQMAERARTYRRRRPAKRRRCYVRSTSSTGRAATTRSSGAPPTRSVSFIGWPHRSPRWVSTSATPRSKRSGRVSSTASMFARGRAPRSPIPTTGPRSNGPCCMP
jgi:[protein-PII] uridylyltransferase